MNSVRAEHPAAGAQVRPLIAELEIRQRVEELGRQIREDAGQREIVLICILKGSVVFAADLLRAIPGDVALEFLRAKSYGQSQVSSGKLEILQDVDRDLAGSYVVIVEDIIDTGLTLHGLQKLFRARKVETLKTVALLLKPQQDHQVEVDYFGFRIGSEFVVGYGLDWAERLRNLPYIGVVEGSS
ncbi:MAG: hypoxanthine phosphoribosyltransferase [Polyangiaceae bacterium]|nr:hypoxanthine phosphoribosyltransferase [Polyangiaceae bacterium]